MPPSPPSTPKAPSNSFSGSFADSRHARRRIRGLSLSSSASSHLSSPSPTASPSPYSSAVPFSWEQRPGIPKSLPRPVPASSTPRDHRAALPLPPPLRSLSDLPFPRKKGFSTAIPNPFAAAFTLCAKDDDGDDTEPMWDPAAEAPRRVVPTASRFRLFVLHGSCKTACAVADTTVRLPRARFLGSFNAGAAARANIDSVGDSVQ